MYTVDLGDLNYRNKNVKYVLYIVMLQLLQQNSYIGHTDLSAPFTHHTMALIKDTNKIVITGLTITAGHRTFSEKLYMNFRPVVQVAGQHVPSCILHCH